jgi:hypothetical protein
MRKCETTFDEGVKRAKAVHWLLMNDPIVRYAAYAARLGDLAAILMAAEFGSQLETKIAEVAHRMEVTDQERREGYPLPANEAERIKRAEARLNAMGYITAEQV